MALSLLVTERTWTSPGSLLALCSLNREQAVSKVTSPDSVDTTSSENPPVLSFLERLLHLTEALWAHVLATQAHEEDDPLPSFFWGVYTVGRWQFTCCRFRPVYVFLVSFALALENSGN